MRYSSERLVRGVIIVMLVIGAVVMVGPFVWMILSSLKPAGEIMRMPPTWFPSTISFKGYEKVLRTVPILTWYKNSLIVSTIVVVMVLLTSSLAGFVFAKFKFPGRDLLFLIMLGTMMIPFHVTMIPLYRIALDLGLQNSYLGIMFPSLVSTFGIFMMRQFIYSIPDDLIDAAILDGCSNLGIYKNIILPLVKPAIGVLCVFQFMYIWDSFLWPLIIVNSTDLYTVPLGLAGFVGTDYYGAQYNFLLATASLTLIPVLIVFVFGHKFMIKGIVMTGFK